MHSSELFPLKSDNKKQVDFLINLLKLNTPKENIHLKQLTGGITNAVFFLETTDKKYIVRVYGNNTEEIIDRKLEQEHMSTINLVSIYAIFGNGMVVSYIEGKTIDLSMMSDHLMSPRIARAVARFHKATFFSNDCNTDNHDNEIFSNIKKFLIGLKPDYVDKKMGQKIDIKHLEETFVKLQKELPEKMQGSKICLCHNDILSANVLYDGENEVNLCDYEYSCYTWPEFDIANHFFEYCGFQCDLKRFPSENHQRMFITNYLSELYGVSNNEIQNNEKYRNDIDVWLNKISLLVKLSDFFWGTWAYFQAINSEVDFPYFEYAQTRIKLMEYHLPLAEGDPMLNEPLVSLN